MSINKSFENKAFFKVANDFCEYIEKHKLYNDLNKFRDLHKRLLIIYQAACSLVYVNSDSNPKYEAITLPIIKVKKYNCYWELFDPYHPDKPLTGSLSDDLANIYTELKTGVQLFKDNEVNEALWHWKFGFDSHWGFHTVDALRALHYVIFRELKNDSE